MKTKHLAQLPAEQLTVDPVLSDLIIRLKAIAIGIRILKYRYLLWARTRKQIRIHRSRLITLSPDLKHPVKVMNYIPLNEWRA